MSPFELGLFVGVLANGGTILLLLWLVKLYDNRVWIKFWFTNRHDTYMIEWKEGSSRYGTLRTCTYRMARVCARELKGKVVGYNCPPPIRAHEVLDDDDDDDGEWWKRGSGEPVGV
jgi:hypothetical protein